MLTQEQFDRFVFDLREHNAQLFALDSDALKDRFILHFGVNPDNYTVVQQVKLIQDAEVVNLKRRYDNIAKVVNDAGELNDLDKHTEVKPSYSDLTRLHNSISDICYSYSLYKLLNREQLSHRQIVNGIVGRIADSLCEAYDCAGWHWETDSEDSAKHLLGIVNIPANDDPGF